MKYTPYSTTTVASKYATTPSITMTGGCYTTIYLPVAGFKLTYPASGGGCTIKYSSGVPNLNNVSSISQTASIGGSGSPTTTYTTTAAGYFILGNGATSNLTITPPNGGYMRIEVDLPKIDWTNQSNTTITANQLKLSGPGSCYFKPITRTVYIGCYTTPSTGGGSMNRSTTTTFSSTVYHSFNAGKSNDTSYTTGLTTSYYYKLGGYGTYYFFDGYGSACRLY